MLASDSDPLLRPEGLAKKGTTLTSNFEPLLRPGIHRTSAYSSSPIGRLEPTGERPTGDARSVRTQETDRASKAGRSSQPQYQGPYPAHL